LTDDRCDAIDVGRLIQRAESEGKCEGCENHGAGS
jgi:hypothetical protein